MQILFSYAFRPFFLLVGGYAALIGLAWWLHLEGLLIWSGELPAKARHGHEMLFGFAGGAIAGFLLTAVATWTRRPAVSGTVLVLLGAVWLLARLSAFLPGPAGWSLWALASLSFWACLLALMAREVFTSRNTRNYKVLLLLLGFLAAETVFFARGREDFGLAEAGLRAGLFLILGMISLVGGRIIPAFTQNWLNLRQPGRAPQLPAFDRHDQLSIAAMAAFALGHVLWPSAALTGVLGVVAGMVQLLRGLRWRGWLTLREPLLWILHLGFAWVAVGFLLLGLAALGWPRLHDAGLHALTYGAIGTLILGVAARVALGHTGRPLQASGAITLAFWLLTLGTLLRMLAAAGGFLMTASIACWTAAFGLFLWRYTPVLLAPRVDAP